MECRVECIQPQALRWIHQKHHKMVWPRTGHIWSQMTQWWQFRQFRQFHFTNFHHETRRRWASLRLPQSQHSTAEVESPSARAERFRTSGGSWGAAKNDISPISPCVTTYSRSACYTVSMFGRLNSVLRSNELVKLWSNFALVSLIKRPKDVQLLKGSKSKCLKWDENASTNEGLWSKFKIKRTWECHDHDAMFCNSPSLICNPCK